MERKNPAAEGEKAGRDYNRGYADGFGCLPCKTNESRDYYCGWEDGETDRLSELKASLKEIKQ